MRSAGAEGSATEREFSLDVRQPYVFGSRNSVSLGAFLTEEVRSDFEQTEVGGSLVFDRNIRARTTLTFRTSGGLIDFDSDSAFTEYHTVFRNDRRDDFLNPTSGTLTMLSARQKGFLFSTHREFLEILFRREGRLAGPQSCKTWMAPP